MPLGDRLADDAYAGYAYAYPHKSAYRPIDPELETQQVWAEEDRDALFLYTHLPFCEMRCGFCNLFTTIKPGADFVATTMSAIARQSEEVSTAIDPGRISQAAFGGGTPSFLTTDEIVDLFHRLADAWPVDWPTIPVSFEISPGTVDETKLETLKSLGVDRISMGVQSFVKADLKALARPQKADAVDQACQWITELGFKTFNLDLIYGMADQTVEHWLYSLEEAIKRGPNELYLYPLYVRQLTGLGRTGRVAGQHRRELYRIGRDVLTDAGFEQVSMRHFRRPVSNGAGNSEYRCQEDGMVGLGPGARSYTSQLHYSTEYAVGQPGVRQIIESFSQRQSFTPIDYGVHLDVDEQHRRFLIQGLLQTQGVTASAFRRRFGIDPLVALPQLEELVTHGLAMFATDVDGDVDADGNGGDERLQLTALGLEHSDAIGPWLYSAAVQSRMEDYELV